MHVFMPCGGGADPPRIVEGAGAKTNGLLPLARPASLF
jgi:hypothetical protein